MNLFFYQLKQAYFSLKQKPGFVFSIVSTMGITLGALLCVLTLAYVMLIKPLPYPEQGRLFVAEHKVLDVNKEIKTVAFGYAGLVHLHQNKSIFEQSTIMYYGQDVITSHRDQPLVNITYTSPELHQLLLSPLALGRIFEASEALNTNNPVAVLSYQSWQQAYDGRPNILEESINISGVSYRIVGVLAESFVEPELVDIGRETQVWLPWDFNPASEGQRQSFASIDGNLKLIGQLKKGLSQSQAKQLLTPLVSERWQKGVTEMAFFKGWSIEMELSSIKEVMLGESESIAVMLLVGVIGLVMIACANISNLFISNAVEKQEQMAIQAAIGATKNHLFRRMFAETSLLMLMSIMLALVVAKTGFNILQQYLVSVLPRIHELSLNLVTFSCAVLVTIILALLFAKLSIRMINYRVLNTSLQSSGKGRGLQVSKKTRQLLIVSQVALATVLVFTNVSLLKYAVKTINAPLGFTTKNISTLILNFSSAKPPTQEETIATMAEIMENLAALPQVEAIAQGGSPLDGFGIKALTKLTASERYTPYFKRIDHRYFSIIEQPLLQGENFTAVDRRENPHAMIVNHAFAKQLETNGNVIGMRLTSMGEPDFIIRGIVKDIAIPGETAFGSDDITAAVPRAYAPNALNTQSFMIKIKAGQFLSRQQLGKSLAEVDSRYAVFSFNAMSDMLIQRLFIEITIAITTTVLALITFFLAGLGLYGVLSYSTQMRRLELGTRMAIGAKRDDLIIMMIKDNAKPVIFGFLLSLIILFGLYLFLSVELSSYLTMQLVPMLVVTLLMIFSLSLLACYLPLRQYIDKPASYSLRGAE